MASYLELKAQAEKLLAEAEQLRQQEFDEAVAEIKAKMQAYGITGRDLGLQGTRASAGARRSGARGPARPVKYRGPNGETWSGGRGRKPEWVVKLLKEGKSLEDFAV